VGDYTKINLKADVEDMAPKFGMDGIESHFAREALEMRNGGLSYYRYQPGYRLPFGHTHSEQEEVYVVVSGSARLAVGDEILELGRLDAVRVPAGVVRATEAGPDGVEIVAFGAPRTEHNDAELKQGWWPEAG
jgi:mannose-6-phosphate isomerase-like protein (cupin superfamily)